MYKYFIFSIFLVKKILVPDYQKKKRNQENMVLDKFGATQLHKPFQKENLNSKQVITGSAHNIKAERNRKDTGF